MKQEIFHAAEIISVGTELLLGDIVNTDAAYLAKELAALGIPCFYQSVVGDNPERLRSVLEEAYRRSDLIFLTGGLGPTCDDLTKETAAQMMGKMLVLHEPSYRRIQAVLAKRGLKETDNQKKQAMLPPDAVVFDNDYGTAPGFAMENIDAGKTMILLPGPPRELEPLFAERVRPYLAARTRETFYSVNIGLYGIGEAAVESCLREWMEHNQNPTIAPYCGDGGEVRVRITARGESEAVCRIMCMETAEQICGVSCAPYYEGILEDYIYGIDCDSLAEAVVHLLKEKRLKLSAAESCTGGYIAKRITDIPGASDVLEGSFVTYSERTKRDLVGVKQETLDSCSVYSAETAKEMAQGAAQAADADIGIGITGLATGGALRMYHGMLEELDAGTVFLCCTCRGHSISATLHLNPGRRNPVEGREYVRRRASTHALWMIFCMARQQP